MRHPARQPSPPAKDGARGRVQYDLTDLRLFVEVTAAGSITAGAAKINLALAAASTRIRLLEERLGVALLERRARGVVPTPAGMTLLRHARAVIEQLEHLKGELADHATGLRGTIRVWANTAATAEFLPAPLAGFLRSYPQLDILLEERPSIEIVPAVAEGQAEIGVVAAQPDMAGLETIPFRLDRLVVVVPPDHPLAARRSIGFAEALPHEFVGLADGSALPAHLARHAARHGTALRHRVQLRSFDAICRMVEHGVGIGIVPATAAARCARTMRIRRLALRDAWAGRRLVLCLRSLDALPPPARKLVEALREA
jgi:DNA-binding transcriptional LysR family regulator